MDEQAWVDPRSTWRKLWLPCCTCLLAVLASAGRSHAAAGISDALATEACWLRPPYALVKCQSERGRYPAQLVRGRESLPSDVWDTSGIVVLETVQDDVLRIALTPRHAVLELVGGKRFRYALVDLEDTKSKPVLLETEQDLHRALEARGEGQTALRFQSFAEVYGERFPWWKRYGLFLQPVMAAGLGGLWLLARWARRRLWPSDGGKRI